MQWAGHWVNGLDAWRDLEMTFEMVWVWAGQWDDNWASEQIVQWVGRWRNRLVLWRDDLTV